MPYVNIKILNQNVTSEQKSALIQRTTDALSDILNKDPKTTYVVIEEINPENWGVGGISSADKIIG